MWDKVGDKLYSAIIRLNIPMEDIPFVDGRFDVIMFLNTWKKGKYMKVKLDTLIGNDYQGSDWDQYV